MTVMLRFKLDTNSSLTALLCGFITTSTFPATRTNGGIWMRRQRVLTKRQFLMSLETTSGDFLQVASASYSSRELQLQ